MIGIKTERGTSFINPRNIETVYVPDDKNERCRVFFVGDTDGSFAVDHKKATSIIEAVRRLNGEYP